MGSQISQILENTKITRVQNQLIQDTVDGINGRILEVLANLKTMQSSIYIAIAIGTIAIIIGIAILWNQRKIKKMLREMMEERENREDSTKETE